MSDTSSTILPFIAEVQAANRISIPLEIVKQYSPKLDKGKKLLVRLFEYD